MVSYIFNDIISEDVIFLESKLYFKKPARNWEEALPIGNGRLGAMVFSGTKKLRLQMNEVTLWNGDKFPDADKKEAYKHLPELRELINNKKYSAAAELLNKEFINNGGGFEGAYSGSYQTFGDMYIKNLNREKRPCNFIRELDISEAVCSDGYVSDKVIIKREYFTSAPAQATFIKIKSLKNGYLNYNLSYELDHIEDITAENNSLRFSGHADGNPDHIAFAEKQIMTESALRISSEAFFASTVPPLAFTIMCPAKAIWSGLPSA